MLSEALNEGLQFLESWLRGNKPSTNFIKIKLLLIASKQQQNHFLKSDKMLALKISGMNIKAVPGMKYPDVYIDDAFSWKEQIQLISTKVSRAMRF